MERKQIGIVASRLMGADSIGMESQKWIDKLLEMGYNPHLICGKLEESSNLPNIEIPELDYKHSEIRAIKRMAFESPLDKAGQKAFYILLDNMVKRIRKPLKSYLEQNKISYLLVEDALSCGRNLPMTLALNKIITELKLPTLGKHYKPFWEINYFTKHANIPKIINQLPSNSKKITHITNSEHISQGLTKKSKLPSKVIPHLINFNSLRKKDDYNKDFRKDFGITDDQIVILQPTKISRVKGMEKSVKLLSEINKATKKDNVLIITGPPVYHRGNYFEEIINKINKLGVKVIFAHDKIFLRRHVKNQKKYYSIGDAYVNSDIISFPSTGPSFGNPVLEAMAYKKPIFVNDYQNLKNFLDKGAKLIVTNQAISQENVSDVCELIFDEKKRKEIVNHNFKLVKKHYDIKQLNDTIKEIIQSYETESAFTWLTRQAKKVTKISDRISETIIPDFMKSGKPVNNKSRQAHNKARTTDSNSIKKSQKRKTKKEIPSILNEYEKLSQENEPKKRGDTKT
ncbi:glycosyltransferase family 4 protein [Candidatus Woesearchaeota archaeon]|jgi:mannosylglucosylglycerate synthase|nr:glycosyltransferase family 4 protein [Candidatus Woesearchaeota archaeon]